MLPRPLTVRRLSARTAFTLIELLTVITIIVVLVGLVIGAAGYANTKAARSRTEGEVKALSAALENYKSDNGIYPRSGNTDALDARADADPTSTNKRYPLASTDLYAMLTGQVDTDGKPKTGTGVAYPAPASTTTKNYWGDLKPSMLGGKDGSGKFPTGVTAINDPFGFSYGYSTAYQKALETAPTVSPPTTGYNPTFDLWSVANKRSTNSKDPVTASTPEAIIRPVWITNW